MNKILIILFLLISFKCNLIEAKESITLQNANRIIFEYAGTNDKAIPTIIISDSNQKNINNSYYKFFKIDNELLIVLKNFIAKDKNLILNCRSPNNSIYDISVEGNKAFIYQSLKYKYLKQTLSNLINILNQYKNTEEMRSAFSDILRRISLIYN